MVIQIFTETELIQNHVKCTKNIIALFPYFQIKPDFQITMIPGFDDHSLDHSDFIKSFL